MDTFSLNSLVFPLRFWFTLSNGAKSPFLRIYTVFFVSTRSKGMFQKSMEKVEILPPFWRLNSSSGGPSSISGGFGRKDGETQLIWFYLRSIQGNGGSMWYSMLLQGGPTVIDGVITPYKSINGLINGQLGFFHPYKWSYFTPIL